MRPENVPGGLIFSGQPQAEQAPTLAVEAQLGNRRADGSVPGSYSAEVMDRMLRYHNLSEAAGSVAMAGYASVAGERIDA